MFSAIDAFQTANPVAYRRLVQLEERLRSVGMYHTNPFLNCGGAVSLSQRKGEWSFIWGFWPQQFRQDDRIFASFAHWRQKIELKQSFPRGVTADDGVFYPEVVKDLGRAEPYFIDRFQNIEAQAATPEGWLDAAQELAKYFLAK